MIALAWQPPTLTTERLVVRPFGREDADSLFRAASNPNVTRRTLWQAHEDLDASLRFITGYAINQYYQEIPEPLAVARREAPAEVIGTVGCFWVSKEHYSMELGYWIAEPLWGKGYAAEASRALVTWLFANYAVNRLQAHCVADNDASERVLHKLGFQFEGVARSAVCLRGQFFDVKRFAVLRDEWRI